MLARPGPAKSEAVSAAKLRVNSLPGNANLPIGATQAANREIGVPGLPSAVFTIYESRVTIHPSSCILSGMHDLGYFREHLGEFEQMAANRGVAIDFDGFRAIDQERRERITAAERLKAERNKASEEIPRRKKAGEDVSALLTEMKQVSEEIKLADERIAELDAQAIRISC